MISFKGTYYDGINSRARAVTVIFNGSLLIVRSDDQTLEVSAPVESVAISPPLGRTARVMTFPGGGICETTDFASLLELEQRTGRNTGLRFVHHLESRWKPALVSVAILVLLGTIFTFYGIPYTAKVVANRISPGALERISSETLALLDKRFLGPSRLSAERKAALQDLLADTFRETDGATAYRLEFRKSPAVGPNAFALPSGTIIVLDELVEIAGTEKEIAGVLAHEISHVKHRHALRQVLQSTGILFMISLVTGDFTSTASITSSLPAVLVQSGYSRRFELEADRDAGLYLIAEGWGTRPYRDILAKMAKRKPEPSALSFLSTHPDMAQRLRFLEGLDR